jgi:hypothetical protein
LYADFSNGAPSSSIYVLNPAGLPSMQWSQIGNSINTARYGLAASLVRAVALRSRHRRCCQYYVNPCDTDWLASVPVWRVAGALRSQRWLLRHCGGAGPGLTWPGISHCRQTVDATRLRFDDLGWMPGAVRWWCPYRCVPDALPLSARMPVSMCDCVTCSPLCSLCGRFASAAVQSCCCPTCRCCCCVGCAHVTAGVHHRWLHRRQHVHLHR